MGCWNLEDKTDTPTLPGYETFEVAPALGGLDHFQGEVPIQNGYFRLKVDGKSVEIETNSEGGSYVKDGTRVKLEHAKINRSLVSVIRPKQHSVGKIGAVALFVQIAAALLRLPTAYNALAHHAKQLTEILESQQIGIPRIVTSHNAPLRGKKGP